MLHTHVHIPNTRVAAVIQAKKELLENIQGDAQFSVVMRTAFDSSMATSIEIANITYSNMPRELKRASDFTPLGKLVLERAQTEAIRRVTSSCVRMDDDELDDESDDDELLRGAGAGTGTTAAGVLSDMVELANTR